MEVVSQRDTLVYGDLPFTTPPEVPMSSVKTSLYPLLLTVVAVMSATGGAWRIG